MSNFKNIFSCAMTFNNGFTVHFESVQPLGTVFTHIWHHGEKIPIDRFTTDPDKTSGYYAYLKTEEFEEVLYKVSKDNPDASEFKP